MRVPKQHYNDLSELFAAIENSKQARNLLEDILTPNEFASLAERWQIVRELARGTTQRDIADKLNVSISKVTRGSRVMKHGKGAFIHFIKKLGKKKVG